MPPLGRGGGPTSPSRWRARSGPLGAGLSRGKGGGGGSGNLGAEGKKRKPRNESRMNFAEYDARKAEMRQMERRQGFCQIRSIPLKFLFSFLSLFFLHLFGRGFEAHARSGSRIPRVRRSEGLGRDGLVVDGVVEVRRVGHVREHHPRPQLVGVGARPWRLTPNTGTYTGIQVRIQGYACTLVRRTFLGHRGDSGDLRGGQECGGTRRRGPGHTWRMPVLKRNSLT